MASHHRGALALLLLVSLSAVAQACYFAREAHLHKDVMRRGRGRGRGRGEWLNCPCYSQPQTAPPQPTLPPNWALAWPARGNGRGL